MKRNLLIIHLEENDIDERMNLLFDFHVQKNLNHISMMFSERQLYDIHLNTIKNQQNSKRHFIIKTSTHQTVGYCWISSIDWINGTCELSISILPKYRIGYGYLALLEMYDYLYNYLNMKTIINQVLEGNELLRSESSIKDIAIKSDFDSYTLGKYRSSYIWSQTFNQHLELEKIKREKKEKLAKKLTTIADDNYEYRN